MNSARVVCYVPYGSWHVHNQVDCIVGTALKLRGAEAVLLTCDGMFTENCYVLAHSSDQKRDCASCAVSGVSFLSQFPLQLYQLRNFSLEADAVEAETWISQLQDRDFSKARHDGIEIGEWVRASVRSYYVVNPRNLDKPEVQALFRLYLRYSWIAYRAFQRFAQQFSPSHVITFGGYGFLHAPVLHAIRQRGGGYVTHERGQLPSRFMLAANGMVDSAEAVTPALEAWSDIPFSRAEFEQVKQVFDSWETGSSRIMGNFYSRGSDANCVRDFLHIPADAKIVAAFTSGEHELGTAEQRRVVGRQLEILKNLIEAFRGRSEYLVIRHHPGLGAGVRSRLDYNYLSRAYDLFQDLPSNVRIVMPNEQLTSYAILWNASAAITTLSTVTIEAMARGLPTATLGLSMFRRASSHEISDVSLGGLVRLVDDLLSSDASQPEMNIRKAFNFMRTYLLRYSTEFKSFGIKNSHEADIKITSVEELLPGRDAELDRVCNFFIEGSQFLRLPTLDEKSAKRDDDIDCFARERDEIISKRQSIAAGQFHSVIPNESTALVVVSRGVDPVVSTLSTHSNASILGHRIRNTTVEHIAVNSDPQDLSLNTIVLQLRKLTTEFVVVACEHARYDEDFIQTGILSIRGTPGMNGARYAAWIWGTKEILAHLPASNIGPSSLNRLQAGLGRYFHPLDILASTVFRRSALLAKLERLEPVAEDGLLEKLIGLLESSDIINSDAPKVSLYRTAGGQPS